MKLDSMIESASPNPLRAPGAKDVHRIEIEPDETGFGKILKQPQ